MAKITPRRRGVLDNPEEVLTAAQQLWDRAKQKWPWLLGAVLVVAVAAGAWGLTAKMQAATEAKAAAAYFQVQAKLPKDGPNAEAVKALERFIQEFPGARATRQAQLQRANFLFDLKQYADAAKAYESLIGFDPGLDLLLKDSLSYCYESLGDYQKAAEILKPLADQGPELFKGDFLRRLAMLYEQAQKPQEAAVYWRKLLENPPDPTLKPYLEEKLAAAEARGKK